MPEVKDELWAIFDADGQIRLTTAASCEENAWYRFNCEDQERREAAKAKGYRAARIDVQEWKERRRVSYLTPHDMRRLDWACAPIGKKFGDLPYLVGSVQTRDDYRDIDIRLIMPDDELKAMTGGSQERHWLMNAAFTALITSMANMPKPIDFQFQSATEAATEDGPRNPLGMR